MCTNDDDQPVRPKIYETSAIEGPQPEEEKDEEEEAKEEEAEDEQGGEARPAWGACEPTEPTKQIVFTMYSYGGRSPPMTKQYIAQIFISY